MADQPITKDILVTFKIFAGGNEIPGSFRITYIDVFRALNKISYATIEFLDGGASDNSEYEVSKSGLLDPGNEVEVKVGYASDEESVFKGIVTKHRLKITERGSFKLQVECKDIAVKMTVARKNAIYNEKKDSAIIKELCSNHGLQVDVTETETEHPELIQHYVTDWDYALMRADVNNLVVKNIDGKLTFANPLGDNNAKLTIRFGSGFFSFDAEMDVKNQYKEVNSYSWDFNEQELIEFNTKEATGTSQGKHESGKLSDVLGGESYLLQSGSSIPLSSLKSWGTSKLTKSRLSKIRGKMKIRGNARVLPDSVVELEGFSDTFDGDAYVSGVKHIVENGKWVTELTLGLSEAWYTQETANIEPPVAGGMGVGMHGLQIGVVKQVHEDPEGNYRIKVSIPTLQNDNIPVWARLSNYYSSAGAGIFFLPELNDEVILGFLNEDPQFPVILGSVYSKKNEPRHTPTEENEIKSILTKSQIEIQFNDKDKILTINTPGGQKIILSDDEESLTIIDEVNKNQVYLSSNGIEMSSEKDISIKAQGNIALESGGDTTVKATGNVQAEGVNVELKGSAKFAAEGAQAEVKGSATTTIKGGIVQIN